MSNLLTLCEPYKEFDMFFAPYQKNRYKLINPMKGNI